MYTLKLICAACGRTLHRCYEDYQPIGSIKCACGVRTVIETESEPQAFHGLVKEEDEESEELEVQIDRDRVFL